LLHCNNKITFLNSTFSCFPVKIIYKDFVVVVFVDFTHLADCLIENDIFSGRAFPGSRKPHNLGIASTLNNILNIEEKCLF